MGRLSTSFDAIDHSQTSGILEDVLLESNAFIGGSSVGQGLTKAAHYYLKNCATKPETELQDVPKDLLGPEDPFYIIDVGIVVSQVYQWRRYFPRVEPFMAVKACPDPVILKTLALLGCNFDCASKAEIRLVEQASKSLPDDRRRPEILYANPCKGRTHLLEAVARGVRMVTFDNVSEVVKCASISKSIQLVLRIITDDRGSQCRLSTKFGAPRMKWRPLLAAAHKHGLEVVGVSFHVGSGCRDATRYEEALKDAKEIFDLAKSEFNMNNMHIIDIGGGFPGETHSMWNPAAVLDEEETEEQDTAEGKGSSDGENGEEENHFMYFSEIAEQVAPVIDRLFPVESGVRIIAEPGRYFVAAAATLCCAVISTRSNEMDTKFEPDPINDMESAKALYEMSREEEGELVRKRGMSLSQGDTDVVLGTIQEELADYSKLFASQQLAQQEVDVYNDSLDFFNEGYETSSNLLGPPDDSQKMKQTHTVEGLSYQMVMPDEEGQEAGGMVTLAAAGEAAVSGMVLQAVADSLQDDYAYYINDGVYGAFNNLMFDHATIRPRVLGQFCEVPNGQKHGFVRPPGKELFASTVFGPTCDSIDVVARSVLLPRLKIGDWMYFSNLGAYTLAAASSFNGFEPSARFYTCSVMPEYFEALIKGPSEEEEEKKE